MPAWTGKRWIELDRQRSAADRVGQRQTQPSERVVHRLITPADLLTRRVIDRDGKVRQLVPKPRRQREVDFHPFCPARRADLERFCGLATSGNRVSALRADQPIRDLAAGGACLLGSDEDARCFQRTLLGR